MSNFKSALNSIHHKAVFGRRVEVLTMHFINTIPAGAAKILDLGSGSGTIARRIMDLRPELEITGVDILIRPNTLIPMIEYDGDTIPFADNHFDYVTIADVLHHTPNPAAVLKEAARVAKHGVIIKDHLVEGFLAEPILGFMDWVGNKGHNVRLIYNYYDRAQWDKAILDAGLKITHWDDDLKIYPMPFSLIFDGKLHFIAWFEKAGNQ